MSISLSHQVLVRVSVLSGHDQVPAVSYSVLKSGLGNEVQTVNESGKLHLEKVERDTTQDFLILCPEGFLLSSVCFILV